MFVYIDTVQLKHHHSYRKTRQKIIKQRFYHALLITFPKNMYYVTLRTSKNINVQLSGILSNDFIYCILVIIVLFIILTNDNNNVI